MDLQPAGGLSGPADGRRLSAERVRVLLHHHGIHLKQPTLVVHSRDPQYDPKG